MILVKIVNEHDLISMGKQVEWTELFSSSEENDVNISTSSKMILEYRALLSIL